MNEQIKTYLKKYPQEIVDMFTALRQLIFDSVNVDLEETMWAKMPSYYNGDKVVRLIPFKDHINVEASEFRKIGVTKSMELEVHSSLHIYGKPYRYLWRGEQDLSQRTTIKEIKYDTQNAENGHFRLCRNSLCCL